MSIITPSPYHRMSSSDQGPARPHGRRGKIRDADDPEKRRIQASAAQFVLVQGGTIKQAMKLYKIGRSTLYEWIEKATKYDEAGGETLNRYRKQRRPKPEGDRS